MAEMNRRIQHSPIVCKRKAGFTVYDVHQDIPRQTTVFSPFVNFILVHSINNENICAELKYLYYYMRNFCNLSGLEQWYFSLI